MQGKQRKTPILDEDWYATSLKRIRQSSNEAQVSFTLIEDVLVKILGFDKLSEIQAQPSQLTSDGRTIYPDFVCRRENSTKVSVIVEVKRLGVNLTKRTSKNSPWTTSPIGQLYTYLERLAESDIGTWGIVTNGTEWIVVRRTNDYMDKFNIPDAKVGNSLASVQEILQDVIESAPLPKKETISEGEFSQSWLKLITTCTDPCNFLDQAQKSISSERVSTDQDAAFLLVNEIIPPDQLIPQNVYLACLRLNFTDGFIAPRDITDCLRLIKDQYQLFGRIYGVAYSDANPERKCRAFLYENEKLHTTALVEPNLPGSRTEYQFHLLSIDGSKKPIESILEKLSSDPLQKSFHEDIGKWFKSTQHGHNELIHLIRTMFVWLLQERGILPDTTLWDPSRKPQDDLEVHEHIQWLFTDVLAVPLELRNPQSDEWKEFLVENVPFLNGSLFSPYSPTEAPQILDNDKYLSTAQGLLSILNRYDWTLCARSGYESESALDPTMLGEMFERLILDTTGIRLEIRSDGQILRKMPEGTYYTPQDLADEMVADAIAEWLFSKIPNSNWENLRSLVHPMTSTKQNWINIDRTKVNQLLNEFTVLDPCCGSGVFTISMLNAIWRAKNRLLGQEISVDDIEQIIEKQLFAVDIHPIAVFITRLRLFISLIELSIRSRESNNININPLPNLETRCICANALFINPSRQAEIGESKDWEDCLSDLRAARELWTISHYPQEKDDALELEAYTRNRLKILSESNWMNKEELAWLDVDLLSATGPAAQYDIQDLFPAPENGWDIVIGNPPYQKPSESDKERSRRMKYLDTSQNLYLMFIQAAITVVKNQGVVTFVVPHSIIFGKSRSIKLVRQLIEEKAERIDIRTYDNGPGQAFPSLPWLKQQKTNRQRVTVITVRICEVEPNANKPIAIVNSRGLHRLSSSNRSKVLKITRLGQRQPKLSNQWSQAPTKMCVDLLVAMRDESQRHVGESFSGRKVSFSNTAMYFITCLPDSIIETNSSDDLLKLPDRKLYQLNDDEYFWPWIGLYNSNLFHSYWLMIGDAFHVNESDYSTIRLPLGWKENKSLLNQTREAAKKLMCNSTLKSCRTSFRQGKRVFYNFNFHKENTPGPEIIDKLDHLLLEAYNLPMDLIPQMQTLRTNGAHALPEYQLPKPSH